MSAPSDLIGDLRAGVRVEDQTADGFDIYDTDAAETVMARAADHIAKLEAVLAEQKSQLSNCCEQVADLEAENARLVKALAAKENT